MVLVMGMGEGLLGRHSFHRQKEGKARLEEQIHGFGRRIPTRMEVRRRLDGPFIGQRGHIQSQDAEGGEERHDVGIGSTGRGWPWTGNTTWAKKLVSQMKRNAIRSETRSGNVAGIQRMLANVLTQDKAAASERQALNEYRHPGGNAELDMQGQDRQAGPGESGDKTAVPIAEGEGFGLDGQVPQEGGRSTEFNTGTSRGQHQRIGPQETVYLRRRRVSPRRRKEGPEAKVGLCQSSDVPIATSLHNEQICMRSNGDSEREGRLLEAGRRRKTFERTSTGKVWMEAWVYRSSRRPKDPLVGKRLTLSLGRRSLVQRDPTAGVTVQVRHVGQGEEEPVHVFSDPRQRAFSPLIQHLEMAGDWKDAGQARQGEESAVRRTEAKPGGEDGHDNIFPVPTRTTNLDWRAHNHKHGVDVPRDPLPGAGEREGAIGYSGFAFASEKLDHQRDLLAFDAVATAALDYKYGLRLILESVRERNAMHSCISQRKLYADELERRSEELEWLLQAVGISWSLSEDAEPPMHCRRAWDAASSLLIPDRVSRSPSDNVELGLCVSEQHGIGEPGRETSGQTKKTIHGGR
ncbi:hypothetical protein C8R47DRAFT_1069256 [Mycena vitilis]|nr:hypothetical protein C8R47DRAFT_1069256 [Mycena vitilis]